MKSKTEKVKTYNKIKNLYGVVRRSWEASPDHNTGHNLREKINTDGINTDYNRKYIKKSKSIVRFINE